MDDIDHGKKLIIKIDGLQHVQFPLRTNLQCSLLAHFYIALLITSVFNVKYCAHVILNIGNFIANGLHFVIFLHCEIQQTHQRYILCKTPG